MNFRSVMDWKLVTGWLVPGRHHSWICILLPRLLHVQQQELVPNLPKHSPSQTNELHCIVIITALKLRKNPFFFILYRKTRPYIIYIYIYISILHHCRPENGVFYSSFFSFFEVFWLIGPFLNFFLGLNGFFLQLYLLSTTFIPFV